MLTETILWLVVITSVEGLPPAVRITGIHEIYMTFEKCDITREYVIKYMKEKDFNVIADCIPFRIVR